eukprot:scaffold42196_cov39-Phaeocystis_antarctica.AAC.2
MTRSPSWLELGSRLGLGFGFGARVRPRVRVRVRVSVRVRVAHLHEAAGVGRVAGPQCGDDIAIVDTDTDAALAALHYDGLCEAVPGLGLGLGLGD